MKTNKIAWLWKCLVEGCEREYLSALEARRHEQEYKHACVKGFPQ